MQGPDVLRKNIAARLTQSIRNGENYSSRNRERSGCGPWGCAWRLGPGVLHALAQTYPQGQDPPRDDKAACPRCHAWALEIPRQTAGRSVDESARDVVMMSHPAAG